MLRRARVVAIASLATACRSSSPPAATDAPHVSVPSAQPAQPPIAPAQTATSSAPARTPAAGSFDCAKDDDCTNSCRHGAVNRRWWEAQYPGGEGCEDGCTSKGSEAPRCEQGRCAAYFMGKPSAECTQKNADVLPGPGPAHRCGADADCRMSCRYGAVNASWYGWGAKGECKDGCDEGRSARCEAGSCVAMQGAKGDPECTRRSIHERN